jgi:hypothetical protein
LTVLLTLLIASAMPTAIPMPSSPPEAPTAMPSPPAYAWIVEVSVAVALMSPLVVVVTVLPFSIGASTSSVMLLD